MKRRFFYAIALILGMSLFSSKSYADAPWEYPLGFIDFLNPENDTIAGNYLNWSDAGYYINSDYTIWLFVSWDYDNEWYDLEIDYFYNEDDFAYWTGNTNGPPSMVSFSGYDGMISDEADNYDIYGTNNNSEDESDYRLYYVNVGSYP